MIKEIVQLLSYRFLVNAAGINEVDRHSARPKTYEFGGVAQLTTMTIGDATAVMVVNKKNEKWLWKIYSHQQMFAGNFMP